MTTLDATVLDTEVGTPDRPLPDEVDVAIVGAGFSGLGTAINLRRRGITDFVVLERGSQVGGTWHYNTYPGCGCDVPSHLYSFSFAPNPGWSQSYSTQPEIRDYLRGCVDRFQIADHIHTGCDLQAGRWDPDAQRWRLTTSNGELSARVLVGAMGPLTEPSIPDLPGLDGFEGPIMHSARWDHDVELDGKRVAVVGTGASAIQFVPEIQSQVAALTVFQRTPPWVVPHPNRSIGRLEQALYRRVPALQRAARGGIYAARELLVLGFVKRPRLMGIVERVARRHIARQVADPELRRKVTPGYAIGCKRILPSNRWYPALAADNVEVVTNGIAEVRGSTVVDHAGGEHPADVIIFGTGFKVTEMPFAEHIAGADGRTLTDVWEGSPSAYMGTAIAGFPNLFLLLGPNTGLGHSSMVYMAESQIAYLVDALATMADHGVEVAEVRPEVARAYNEQIDGRLEGTVWNTGCASWYLDDSGRNPTLWPDWTWRFRQRLSAFDDGDYLLTERAERADRGERADAVAA
jgi:cation diffusion facilitator CzcD-associated flavoprotein CzcO